MDTHTQPPSAKHGPPNCPHWVRTTSTRGGACSISYYGERPSYAVCAHCMSNGGPKIRGAGDLVSIGIDKAIGAKAHQGLKNLISKAKGGRPCGCKKRQDALNRLIPSSAKDAKTLRQAK